VIDSLSDTQYFGVTVSLILICITLAICVKDPEVIFEVSGSMTMSLLCFILPGYFYLSAKNQLPPENENRACSCGSVVSVFMLIFGVLFFVICTGYALR